MKINPLDLLKNAKELEKSMSNIQKMMEDVTVTGRAGGGMVEIDLNGHMDIVDVRIEPAVLKPENSNMIEDLIVSAASDATSKIREKMTSEMSGLVASQLSQDNKDGSK